MQLALIGNLSVGEAVVILILAVLVFGRRLPEVAARVFHGLQDLRRNFDRLRRETGIDEELRKVSGSLREVEREARLADALRAPSEPRRPRAWDRPAPKAAGGSGEVPAPAAPAAPEASEAPRTTEDADASRSAPGQASGERG